MELIPPEPQVGFRLCLVLLMLGCNKFLLGRFGSWIDPLSGTTLLLIFLGQDKMKWMDYIEFPDDTVNLRQVCNQLYFQLLPNDACPSRPPPMADEVWNQSSLSSCSIKSNPTFATESHFWIKSNLCRFTPMGPAPWAQQLLTLLAPHLLKPPGEQDQDQDPPTQVWQDDHCACSCDW